MKVNAYGAHAGDKPLKPMQISRREPGAHDVQIDIAFCGVCHSDLHQARAEWEGTHFPCVPGHEIVGRVSAIGAHVTSFKAGDLVGVGCIVDSCRHCEECDAGLENYCDGMISTYNFPTPDAPGWTLGGYLQKIVVHERYVLRVCLPEQQLAAVVASSGINRRLAGPDRTARQRPPRSPPLYEENFFSLPAHDGCPLFHASRLQYGFGILLTNKNDAQGLWLQPPTASFTTQ